MEKIEVTRAKVIKLFAEVTDKVLERNAAYHDAWQRQGICGVLTRLSDKLVRISNWYGREVIIQGESTKDDLIDAIGYSMLGLLYLEEMGRLPTPAEIVDEHRKARAVYDAAEKAFLDEDAAIMKEEHKLPLEERIRKIVEGCMGEVIDDMSERGYFG